MSQVLNIVEEELFDTSSPSKASGKKKKGKKRNKPKDTKGSQGFDQVGNETPQNTGRSQDTSCAEKRRLSTTKSEGSPSKSKSSTTNGQPPTAKSPPCTTESGQSAPGERQDNNVPYKPHSEDRQASYRQNSRYQQDRNQGQKDYTNNHRRSSRGDNYSHPYSQKGYQRSTEGTRSYDCCPHGYFKRDCERCCEEQIKYSKMLSNILRHGAHKKGLDMDSAGYVDVQELFRLKRFSGCTIDDIKEIVRNDSKQRFHLQPTGTSLRICANQGHSFEVEDLDLEDITDPTGYDKVVHGTYDESWRAIKKTGLHRMQRQYIHFCNGDPGSKKIISGARQSANILIFISMKKALADGLKFYRSRNDVILCPGDQDGYLRPKYFEAVVHRFTGHRLPLH